MLQTKTNVRVLFRGRWLCGTDHNAVLVGFLSDFANDGNKILIQTAASQETIVDISFLIFQVRSDQRSLHIGSMFRPAGWHHRC